MSLDGQRLQLDRYSVVPRTLSFLLRDGQVLLQRLKQTRGAWAGLHNGLGGHIERGENPHRAALREIEEEVGLTARDLSLCGVVIIDTLETVGIGLYVFVGEASNGDAHSSAEGDPIWVELDRLDTIPLVEDLPELLPRAIQAYRQGSAFCAGYRFDEDRRLEIDWLP